MKWMKFSPYNQPFFQYSSTNYQLSNSNISIILYFIFLNQKNFKKKYYTFFIIDYRTLKCVRCFIKHSLHYVIMYPDFHKIADTEECAKNVSLRSSPSVSATIYNHGFSWTRGEMWNVPCWLVLHFRHYTREFLI